MRSTVKLLLVLLLALSVADARVPRRRHTSVVTPVTADPAATAAISTPDTAPVTAAEPDTPAAAPDPTAVAPPTTQELPATATAAPDAIPEVLAAAAEPTPDLATTTTTPTPTTTAAADALPASAPSDIPAAEAAEAEVPDPTAATATAADEGRFSSPPKLYLYAWCGVSVDQLTAPPNDNNDFVAVIDATPTSKDFGKVINVASTPYVATQPHHCNVDITGKWFAAGGLLSLLQPNTPDIFMFDVSNPAKPVYKHGLTSSSGACMDEFVAHKNGGFAVSSMCGRDGHQGGGVVRIPDPAKKSMIEYNGGLAKADQTNFTSHGVDIDYATNRMVTADYFDVLSSVIQNPQPPLNMMHTAHIWDTKTMKVIKIADLSGITDGLMEARFSTVPGVFWVSGGLGKLHAVQAIDDKWCKPSKKTGRVIPNVYCLDKDCNDVPGTCLTSEVFRTQRGPRMLLTSFALSQVRLVDVSNPYAIKTLSILHLPAGAGAHVVKFNQKTSIAAVATYLLDIAGTVLRLASDRTVRLLWIDQRNDQIVEMPNGVVDFNTAVPTKGASDCHGLAFNYVNHW